MFSSLLTGNPFNLYTVILSVFAGYLTYKAVLYLMTLLGLRVTVAHANAISYTGYLCAIRPAGAALYDGDFCSGLKIIKPEVAPDVDADADEVADDCADEVVDEQSEPVVQVQAFVDGHVDDDSDEVVDEQSEPVVQVQAFVDDHVDDDSDEVVDEAVDDDVEEDVDFDFDQFECGAITRLSNLRPEDFVEVSNLEEEYCSSEAPVELAEYYSSDEPMELAEDEFNEVEWTEELSTGLIILGENDVLCDDDEIDPAYWKLAV